MRKKSLLLLIKLYLINKNIHKQRNIWIIKFVYLIAIILLICFIFIIILVKLLLLLLSNIDSNIDIL
jgi:hypothetical protein